MTTETTQRLEAAPSGMAGANPDGDAVLLEEPGPLNAGDKRVYVLYPEEPNSYVMVNASGL